MRACNAIILLVARDTIPSFTIGVLPRLLAVQTAIYGRYGSIAER
jgi:hypothetical protein